MSMVWGTIATICIQAYTAHKNYKKNKENAEKIKELQRDYKESKQKHGIERDKEKFLRSCELQMLMEEEDHKYKIECIHSRFLESIKSLMQKQELRDYYPLVLSPQIISNSILPTNIEEIETVREHILCILTCSNNSLFNKLMFADLDNYLCSCFSKYWNKSSQHQVCYYTNVWRKDKLLSYDASDWNNLRPLISSPTVFITPLISSSNEISVRITLMVNGAEFHCERKLETKFELDPNSDANSIKDFKYRFKNLAFSGILCDAAFVVDSHYWCNHKFPPRLPRLLRSKSIIIDSSLEKEYILNYENLYRCSALGSLEGSKNLLSEQDKEEIQFLASIDQFNYPQRSVSFLESLLLLPIETSKAESLILDTLSSVCNARTIMSDSTIDGLDVSQLDREDMAVISKLADLSNTHQLNTSLISTIIQKWIYNW